jgi:hypothetical protein
MGAKRFMQNTDGVPLNLKNNVQGHRLTPLLTHLSFRWTIPLKRDISADTTFSQTNHTGQSL